jgi:Flp pilus assembly protein TadD
VVLALVLAFPFRLAYQSAAIYSGQAYALAGRPDAGVARYAGALKLGSGDVRLHWFAAAAALQAGDIPAALERSGEAVRMEPYLNDAWYTRGVVLKAAGRDREAEEAYRAALKINPGYALAWNNLGNLLGARGRLKEAEEAQRRALQLDPGFREARQNLAITLMMLKKSAEARRIMEGGTP